MLWSHAGAMYEGSARRYYGKKGAKEETVLDQRLKGVRYERKTHAFQCVDTADGWSGDCFFSPDRLFLVGS